MKRPSSVLLAAALVAAAFCCFAPAATATAPQQTPGADLAFVREIAGVREYRVEANGLQVLLRRDPSAPVVTVMTTYRVGSRNEVTGTTGATHLLEHLFFKGTERFNTDRGTSLDQLLDRVGADNNATTGQDRTAYYVNAPSDQLPLVCDILADHMRHLRLKEEDRAPEMTVVRNEFENGENDPFSVLDKGIWSAAFVAHPYHHPVIGWRSDIEGVPIEKLRGFHETFYWPNNCTLIISGDFAEPAALELVRRHFAPIPRSPHPIPELYTEEPEQQGSRRFIIERPGRIALVGAAFKRPAGLHTDSPALAVLGSALGDGMTGRLYRALVDTGLASQVAILNNAQRDPALFTIYAVLVPGTAHDRVEAALLSALQKVAAEGITNDELTRARRQITAQTAYNRDGPLGIASALTDAVALGDWTDYATFLERINTVTVDDVRRVAHETFDLRRNTTGWFVPQLAGGESAGGSTAARPAQRVQHRRTPAADGAGAAPGGIAESQISAKAFHREIAGVDFVALPTGVKDVVTIHGSLAAGSWFNPAGNTAVADLAAALLDKGTTTHTKFALAETLDALGATISFGSDRLRLTFSARCLRADAAAVIALLAEQLRSPAFADDEIAKEKARLAADLEFEADTPANRASVALSQALWPEGHPQRQNDPARVLADLPSVTREQLFAFHRANFGPRSLRLVVVGDLDPAALAEAVAKSFANWSGGVAYPAVAHLPTARAHGETIRIPMPEKPSITFLLGQSTQLQARDPDALALKVATHALGGPTFSSRLMSKIRNEEGLTYGIGARVAGDTFTDGTWFIRGTFAASLLARGEESTRRELTRWYEKGLTADELAVQKANYIGTFKLGLSTTAGMADALLGTLERGETLADLDARAARINALTLDQVNSALRRHLAPGQMVSVRAGELPGETPAP